jgi:hypothetical protein
MAGQLKMMQIVLIGFCAGAASALLFASVASGILFSILLFYLAPLPVMIAAIGWSHWAGLAGAAAASAILAFVFQDYFFVTFLIGIGLPAWWLGYLALLARPAPAAHGFEWYPPGRLVLWSAIIGTLVVVAAIPHFGFDLASFQTALKELFEGALPSQTDGPADTSANELSSAIDAWVFLAPSVAAAVSTAMLLLNLWLAGRIVKISGRLRRPWPNIPAMTFPALAPALIGVAVACSFLPDLAGLVSRILVASLLVAYALLGFAVLHTITRDLKGRGLVLASAYAAVFVFGVPMLMMTLLGLADTAFGLRARFAVKGGPPPAPRP